jgi:PAS domain S-box-containing protein
MNSSKSRPQIQLDNQVWQRIFNAVPDGLMVTDRQYNILFINSKFSSMSGIEASRLVGKKCCDVLACAACHTADCPLSKVRVSGEPLIVEGDGHCKNRNQRPWIIAMDRYPDDEGGIAGYVERFMDASAFRQVESALSRSNDKLRKNMGAIIQAMSTTIEKRDPYTAGHQRRVTKLCRAIATRLGFSWERIQGLRMAAAVHDLGKIHVPAEILNKPGPISKHERAIIRMHPRTGYEILKGIQFPWPLAEIIYQHHERLNGGGYPRRLAGDRILPEARILAVADVVESMVSFRPYRPELGLEAALTEIRKHSGTLYDSTVVDVCSALFVQEGFDFKTKAWQRSARG